MRVLVTNNTLMVRGGAEAFVRDLARALQRRGHRVMAYTTDPAAQPRLLENDPIPVVTDLERLPLRPDVIHAQHHLDAMTALAALPGVPAIYHCHGAVWRECPPLHPRIHRYAAVTPTLAERLSVEYGLAPERVRVVPNGVDLERFAGIRRPAARPARVLFYSHRHLPGSPTFDAVREAAVTRGLAFDAVGRPFGTTTQSPETLLPGYDVVFASGLSALEALACGCAVVVLGRTSCGDLVRLDAFDAWRAANFTIPVNSPPPSAAAVGAALDGYDAADVAAVTALTRARCGFDAVADALVGLYEEAVAARRDAMPDATAEILALGRYLRGLAPLVKLTDAALAGQWASPTRASSLEELRAELGIVDRRLAEREALERR
jgi:glycosyltransferase involved in cell wall biosynthesis